MGKSATYHGGGSFRQAWPSSVGGGEVNTMTNVGTGDGQVYKQKVGVQFEVKTVKDGKNVDVVDNVSDVTIQTVPNVALTETALVDAATIVVDASTGNTFTVVLAGNRTLGNPTNPTVNQKIVFRITQDGTGSRTLAYDTKYRFGDDLPLPTLSTGTGDIDYLGFIYHSGDDKWDFVAKAFGY